MVGEREGGGERESEERRGGKWEKLITIRLCSSPLYCSVGDAACTIAACTSFPEPFITPPGQKRLSFSHKKFAGHRASDHLAMLNAFYQWERARCVTIYSCFTHLMWISRDLLRIFQRSRSGCNLGGVTNHIKTLCSTYLHIKGGVLAQEVLKFKCLKFKCILGRTLNVMWWSCDFFVFSQQGDQAEWDFCQSNYLASSSLRMAGEARVSFHIHEMCCSLIKSF